MINKLLEFDGFEWDEGNIGKSLIKHKITISNTEDLFLNCKTLIFEDKKHSKYEPRYLCLGQTSHNLHLVSSFTLRTSNGRIFIRPISTRKMNKKEKDFYEKEISKIQY